MSKQTTIRGLRVDHSPAAQDALELMGKIKNAVMIDFPFYGALLAKLPLIPVSNHPTMATDGKVFAFNPAFVRSKSYSDLFYISVHEPTHCALGHPFMRGEMDPRIFNEACDHAVNLLLNRDPRLKKIMPAEGLADPRFEGWSAVRIYHVLMKEKQEREEKERKEREEREQKEREEREKQQAQQPQGPKPQPEQPPEGGDEDGGDDAQQQDGEQPDDGEQGEPGEGQPGSDGEPSDSSDGKPDADSKPGDGDADGDADGEQDDAEGDSKGSESSDAEEEEDDDTPPAGSAGSMGDVIDPTTDADEDEFAADESDDEADAADEDSDGGGSERRPLDEAELAELRNEWENAATVAAIAAGDEGETLLRDLELAHTPVRSLQEHVDEFCQQVTSDEESWSRPNRQRLASGSYLPSHRSPGVRKLVVGIDTSASITKQDLGIMQSVCSRVQEEFAVSEMIVVYVDTSVRNIERFDRHTEIQFEKPAGGGGTYFAPLFQWVLDENEDGVCGVIYLTDQENFDERAMAELQFDLPTLWVNIGKEQPAPFGKVCSLLDY